MSNNVLFNFLTSLEQRVTIDRPIKTTPINQHKPLRRYYLCKEDLNQLHVIFSCEKADKERASLNRRERVIGLLQFSPISQCVLW